MSARLLRVSQVVADVAVLALALVLAFAIRFDGVPSREMLGRLLGAGPYVVSFEYLALFVFGVHRFSWRFVGLRDASRILVATATSTSALLAVRLAAGAYQAHNPELVHGAIPLGVVAMNFVLAFLGIAGVRVARRMSVEGIENRVRRRLYDKPSTRILLVGAGQAGVMVARELVSRPDLAMRAVGFLDDDATKHGTVIHGIPVVGPTARIPELCSKYRAEQVLITMASAPGNVVRRIRQLCEETGVAVKIIPGMYELVGGQVNLSRIRDVAIEDLLRREPVDLDLASIASYVTGKVVLATGAGGSIGSELCRQICRFAPAALVLVERSENVLFNIHRELIASHPELEIVPCMADITDVPRMTSLLAEHRPSIVLHAAAHKHVPMMEWNPGEAVKNNVLGTKIVADLASEHDVQVFVMISTDKAVNPTSVMGATKRVAEAYVQTLSRRSKTRFVTVRFGNVLGSAGSVIPIFQEQIARGGPVTITHADMRRYFMTIPEACQLVLQAGSMGQGGEIFILDMGEPVRIVDLARDLIALSGLREGDDIEIEVTGIRPGEKLFEELSTDGEQADKTRHPKIFVGRIEPQPWELVQRHLASLERATSAGHGQAVRAALRSAVPEFAPQKAGESQAPPADAAPVPSSVPIAAH